jgi:D-aminopeptidase
VVRPVAPTADGWLNDMNSFRKSEHVRRLRAAGGHRAEWPWAAVPAICYEFKGGTGTSSRQLPETLGGWTVAALVQSNFGRRHQLTIAGVPVCAHLREGAFFTNGENPLAEQGSLIVVLATDAPLLPHQLRRVAKRATLGMARTGSLGGNGSGDIFLAFSTANAGAGHGDDNGMTSLLALANDRLDPLFYASVYATSHHQCHGHS